MILDFPLSKIDQEETTRTTKMSVFECSVAAFVAIFALSVYAYNLPLSGAARVPPRSRQLQMDYDMLSPTNAFLNPASIMRDFLDDRPLFAMAPRMMSTPMQLQLDVKETEKSYDVVADMCVRINSSSTQLLEYCD